MQTEALSRVEGTNQMLLPADRIAELAAGVLTALHTLHQQVGGLRRRCAGTA